MANTAGGVRGKSSSRSFSTDARSMFNDIESGYGRARDYSSYQTKRLQSLQKIGRDYNPKEKEQAIQDYVTFANRRTGGRYFSIDHYDMTGPRSELVRVAQRASAAKNLQAITEELRRRRKR